MEGPEEPEADGRGPMKTTRPLREGLGSPKPVVGGGYVTERKAASSGWDT